MRCLIHQEGVGGRSFIIRFVDRPDDRKAPRISRAVGKSIIREHDAQSGRNGHGIDFQDIRAVGLDKVGQRDRGRLFPDGERSWSKRIEAVVGRAQTSETGCDGIRAGCTRGSGCGGKAGRAANHAIALPTGKTAEAGRKGRVGNPIRTVCVLGGDSQTFPCHGEALIHWGSGQPATVSHLACPDRHCAHPG